MTSPAHATNDVISPDTVYVISAAANHTAAAAHATTYTAGAAASITDTMRAADITSTTSNSADVTTDANVANNVTSADDANDDTADTDDVTNSAPTPSSNPATSSTPNPSPKPSRVFTIPLDLPLTEDEQSALTFIPLCPHINEFHSHLPNQSPSTDTLICLTKLVLTLNNFSFNSSHPLQTKGVAMGTQMGPSYACLFVGLETDIYFKPTNSHMYLDYTSSHLHSYMNVIPYSKFLHLCRICSQEGAFHSWTSQMFSYFKDHNIPPQ
eukprot:g30021.t1